MLFKRIMGSSTIQCVLFHGRETSKNKTQAMNDYTNKLHCALKINYCKNRRPFKSRARYLFLMQGGYYTVGAANAKILFILRKNCGLLK